MRHWIYWSPVFAIAALIAAFIYAMVSGRDPQALPSTLLNKPVAANFQLIDLFSNKKYDRKVFDQKVTLVNFFASWCVPCKAEHSTLLELQKKYPIQIIGIVYNDKPDNIRQYIAQMGNPYRILYVPEKSSSVALDWGITGVPETFVIDQNAIIQFRLQGSLNEDGRKQKIESWIQKLLART